MKVEGLERAVTVVGENMHCTRVLLRKGKRIVDDPDGQESIVFTSGDGQQKYLRITESVKKTNDYSEGRVKHVQTAVRIAMQGDGADYETAMDYLRTVAQRQIGAGVDFLDLNVDEISIKYEEQEAAMRWLVATVQSMTDARLSIDSSRMETLEAGLDAFDTSKSTGGPMLNSASLERKEALDLAVSADAEVIVTAAGESGMPDGDAQRVDHATQMIDAALAKGIALGNMHVDLLVFPISVDETYGRHFLDAVNAIREKYGPEIHITGGMSNVSFGLPARRLINDVFFNLVLDAGADGGIIDPVARDLSAIVSMDRNTPAYELARNMLLGDDRQCKTFLRAWRKKELKA